jgi:hypothetical protein
MNKKVIWVGIASALLIGGGIFWWMRNKNKPTNEPKKEDEEKGTNEMATTTTTTTSYDSTGFNQEQGDAFRLWMNKKKLINSFTSEYTTKPYIKGGGDGRGNFEQGQYVGVLIDLKKDPLKNKIVAKFKNISSYPKDINDKAMFEFWVNWADVITAI